MSWQPILEGPLAGEARAAVIDIARALAAAPPDRVPVVDAALFWAYTAGFLDDAWSAQQYELATDRLTEHPPAVHRLSLYGGAAGLGFALAHISDEGSADEALAAIDATIITALEVPRWQRDYDLIGGLAGLLVYLLERVRAGSASAAERGIDLVLAHLSATSEVTSGGRTWHTSPELLPSHQRAAAPHGYYNCGMAHGVAGVLAVLARTAEERVHPQALQLALEALRWLQDQGTGAADGSYPAWIIPGQHVAAARTAWCYGDAGVAIAAWRAARACAQPSDPALALTRLAARRDAATCRAIDAGLCHGTAGLAHLFNRLHQASGDHALGEVARSWVRRTLELRRPGGVAGFLAWQSVADQTPGWVAAYDLLEGVIGIGLALQAALGVEPAWDRLLCCEL